MFPKISVRSQNEEEIVAPKKKKRNQKGSASGRTGSAGSSTGKKKTGGVEKKKKSENVEHIDRATVQPPLSQTIKLTAGVALGKGGSPAKKKTSAVESGASGDNILATTMTRSQYTSLLDSMKREGSIQKIQVDNEDNSNDVTPQVRDTVSSSISKPSIVRQSSNKSVVSEGKGAGKTRTESKQEEGKQEATQEQLRVVRPPTENKRVERVTSPVAQRVSESKIRSTEWSSYEVKRGDDGERKRRKPQLPSPIHTFNQNLLSDPHWGENSQSGDVSPRPILPDPVSPQQRSEAVGRTTRLPRSRVTPVPRPFSKFAPRKKVDKSGTEREEKSNRKRSGSRKPRPFEVRDTTRIEVPENARALLETL